MRIQHNIAALNSYRQLGTNNSAISKNLEKLSSGYKINRAGDDAAGLAISEKMRAQITGLETAQKNANDGISLVQTAEGALTEVHSMLNRMVELSTQASNGIYNTEDRANLQAEVDQLTEEIDRISDSTNFNGINLLDGSMGQEAIVTGNVAFTQTTAGADNAKAKYTLNLTGLADAKKDGSITISFAGQSYTVDVSKDDDATAIATALAGKIGKTFKGTTETGDFTVADGSDGTITFEAAKAAKYNGILAKGAGKGGKVITNGELDLQIGDTADEFNKITVQVGVMNSTSLGLLGLDITSTEGADAAIGTFKAAIDKVSSTRGNLGAIQNRLEHTINNLGVTTENITSAESRIRDTDMADEMMAYTKNNILVQASQAMLAQANTLPQGVLQLLQ